MQDRQNPTSTSTTKYWEGYYAARDVPVLPSQFAVFCLGESEASTVIDIGCGSGRDSFFFARRNIRTLGIDLSTKAIEHCRRNASQESIRHADFVCKDVRESGLGSQISELVAGGQESGECLIYSRFFLHAIDEECQQSLLTLARGLLSARTGRFALEFRTPRDRSLEKATPDHYRRYVDPAMFIAHAHRHGFSPLYTVEGFGLAKYRCDDAYVARVVLTLD